MKGELIPVLDRGFVRLVDHMGDDLSVVRAARVSYDADWRAGEEDKSDSRLIHYLMKNRHTSPFKAVTFTFEVKAPIFIFRQWHRHRTHSYNEVSARYIELPEEFYVPDPMKVGEQSSSNKQARVMSDDEGEAKYDQRVDQVTMLDTHCRQSFGLYNILLDQGWPRELARMVLPLSTYNRMFDTVNLHNLFHFLTLRLHPYAQWEIQQYAQAIVDLISPIVPTCIEAWEAQRARTGT